MQPNTEQGERTIDAVSTPVDLRPILWSNVESLMRHRWGSTSRQRLADLAEVGPATIQRIAALQVSTGIDVVAAIANALGVHPWQLLVADADPLNLPKLDRRGYSPQAADLAATLDGIADSGRRQQAYTAAIAVLTLAAMGRSEPPQPLAHDL